MSRARRRTGPTVLAVDGDLVVERDPARPSGRLLRQGAMDASYVDLADATHLEFDYMRWLRIVLRAARVRRVVHVGGAACALARALVAEELGGPDGRQEVCEIDADVLRIARDHMGLRRMPGLRVRHAEGRAHLAGRADDSADAVVIDAFLGARVPARLTSAEAFAELARVAPLGLVNVVDDRAGRLVDELAAGLSRAYGRVWALGGRVGNTILAGERVAEDRTPLDLARIAAAAAADPSPARLLEPAELARRADAVPARRDRD